MAAALSANRTAFHRRDLVFSTDAADGADRGAAPAWRSRDARATVARGRAPVGESAGDGRSPRPGRIPADAESHGNRTVRAPAILRHVVGGAASGRGRRPRSGPAVDRRANGIAGHRNRTP